MRSLLVALTTSHLYCVVYTGFGCESNVQAGGIGLRVFIWICSGLYVADVLHPVTDLPGRRRLRSSSTSAVVVPSTRLRTIGDRAFPAAASRTWNSLPLEVKSSRTFKSTLKTFSFFVQ